MTSTTAAQRCHTVLGSPVGRLTLVASAGALVGLYMDRQRHRPSDQDFGTPDEGPFADAARQLEEYFAGERTAFDLALAPAGTPFQRAVWEALLEIPYGETLSYGELAARIGRPGGARAAGMAVGRNPIGVVVPCHRVVGADGSLTGYGGGLRRKQQLLDLERGRLSLTV